MSGVGELVEVVLRFPAGGFVAEPYVDGFELRAAEPDGWLEGRRWPLDPSVGFVRTSRDNEVGCVRVRGCKLGVVERSPSGLRSADGELSAPMGWPGRCVAVVEHEAAVSRYQVRLSDDEVVRWAGLEGCAASLGFSKAGRLVCLVVDAPRVVPVHTALVFDEAGYWAVLNDHRRLSLERDPWGATDSWLESERNLSAARQNAWLSLAADGVVTELYVNDVADGDAIGFDRAAPVVDAVQCWVSWPAEVRASRWPDGDRTCIAVLFGVDDVELWQCLGSSRLWVGTGAGGELRTLVLADADEAPPGWLEAAEYDDWSEDPAEMPHLARWVAIAPTLRFDLYGLVGKLADGVSGRSGRGGVPSGLELTFEDDDDERCMTVNSSREGLATTRLNMSLSMQDDSHTATMIDDWQPAMISVDGAPVEFMARHAEDQWLALARLGATTVSVSARGCELSEINLVSRIDMAAHVEHARAHERQRIDKLLTPQGRLRFEQRRQISPEERLRRIGVHRLVTDLTRAIMRRPDAPDLGPLFTGRVAAAWGGADRYQRMLWLHTMLRPVNGVGTSGPSPLFEDDTALIRVSLSHPPPPTDQNRSSRMFVVLRSTSGHEPPRLPNRDAISRGEEHHLDLRIVNHDGTWLVDTDLLAILIDRLGTLAEVVLPISDQM